MTRQRVSRWLGGAAVVIGVAAASMTYGFWIHERRLFPYSLLLRAQRLFPAGRPAHERHARRANEAAALTPERRELLANLPYLKGYRPATAGGAIRRYDPSSSENGLNFFTSAHAPVAMLMDMDGRIVKTWKTDASKVFPGLVVDPKYRGNDGFLRDAERLPDGGIVGLFDEIGIVRLDAASRVVWSWRAPVHHDVVIGAKGEIWVLAHESRVVPEINRQEPILEDFIVELSPEGKPVRRISLVDCFQRSPYAPLLRSAWGRAGDVLHTNSLAVLDGNLADRSPSFRGGNLLVSLRNPGVVAIVDPSAGEVVWALSGIWHGQHSAQLLPDRHLLLFDNLGTLRKASRVLEVDPLTQRILWSFGGRAGEDLLSESNGFVERLPGGNTLVTESNSGRVLEITPENRVVWEFVNPYRVGENRDLIAVVYFMKRVRGSSPALKRPDAAAPSGLRLSPPREGPRRPSSGETPPRAAA
jgi:hypothetical protein